MFFIQTLDTVIERRVTTSTPKEKSISRKTVTVIEPQPEFDLATLSQDSVSKEGMAATEDRAVPQVSATSNLPKTSNELASMNREGQHSSAASGKYTDLRTKVPRALGACKMFYNI